MLEGFWETVREYAATWPSFISQPAQQVELPLGQGLNPEEALEGQGDQGDLGLGVHRRITFEESWDEEEGPGETQDIGPASEGIPTRQGRSSLNAGGGYETQAPERLPLRESLNLGRVPDRLSSEGGHGTHPPREVASPGRERTRGDAHTVGNPSRIPAQRTAQARPAMQMGSPGSEQDLGYYNVGPPGPHRDLSPYRYRDSGYITHPVQYESSYLTASSSSPYYSPYPREPPWCPSPMSMPVPSYATTQGLHLGDVHTQGYTPGYYTPVSSMGSGYASTHTPSPEYPQYSTPITEPRSVNPQGSHWGGQPHINSHEYRAPRYPGERPNVSVQYSPIDGRTVGSSPYHTPMGDYSVSRGINRETPGQHGVPGSAGTFSPGSEGRRGSTQTHTRQPAVPDSRSPNSPTYHTPMASFSADSGLSRETPGHQGAAGTVGTASEYGSARSREYTPTRPPAWPDNRNPDSQTYHTPMASPEVSREPLSYGGVATTMVPEGGNREFNNAIHTSTTAAQMGRGAALPQGSTNTEAACESEPPPVPLGSLERSGLKQPGHSRKEIRPERYDGSTDWTDYIKHFESVAQWNRWATYDKAAQLSINLTGAARQAWSDSCLSAVPSFEELKTILKQRFKPEGQDEAYKAEFRHRNQRRDESFLEFGHALRRLATRAFATMEHSAREELLKDQFIQNLEGDMRRHVTLAHPKNLDQAIVMATEHDTVTHSLRTPPPQKPRTVAAVAGGEKEGEGGVMELLSQVLKSMNRPNSRGPRVYPDTICWYCDQQGHMKYQCEKFLKSRGQTKNEGETKPKQEGDSQPKKEGEN